MWPFVMACRIDSFSESTKFNIVLDVEHHQMICFCLSVLTGVTCAGIAVSIWFNNRQHLNYWRKELVGDVSLEPLTRVY